MFNLFKKKTELRPDRSSIVPRIKHTNMLAALAKAGAPPDQLPFTEPLVSDLLIAYAFDLPGVFQMVKVSDLPQLGLTPQELRDLAIENLKRQLTDIRAKGQGTPIMWFTAGEDLGACLLLVDKLWLDLGKELPGEVVVAVPERGTVFVTSTEWPGGLELMRELTDGTLERSDTHRLTKHFLVRREGVWVPFESST
jgi:uncharacterized protein YtpQ (UPF0354 family)